MGGEAGAAQRGVPLRWVVLGAVLLTAGTVAYAVWTYRSLRAKVYQATAIAVEEIPAADQAALRALHARVRADRDPGGWVELTEPEWNQLLLDQVLRDPDRAIRIRLAPPFLRVELSQPAGEGSPGRFLNARLLVQPFAGADGLGAAVRGGEVGAVSLESAQADWVRGRIERQLTAEWERDPALRAALEGLREVRVRAGRVALRFAAARPPRPTRDQTAVGGGG